jgi:hypothetical protein
MAGFLHVEPRLIDHVMQLVGKKPMIWNYVIIFGLSLSSSTALVMIKLIYYPLATIILLESLPGEHYA